MSNHWFIGHVRFTTTDYARDKISDDSSIVFKIGSEGNFGRIRRIFTVDEGRPMLYVESASKMTNFQFNTATDVYSYAGIQTGSFEEETNHLFINVNDIFDKCVIYIRRNKMYTFFPISEFARKLIELL